MKSKGASLIEAVVAFSVVTMIIFILTSLLSSMIVSQERQICQLNAYSKDWMFLRKQVDSIQTYAHSQVEQEVKQVEATNKLETLVNSQSNVTSQSLLKSFQTIKGSASHACFEEVEAIELIHMEKETTGLHTN
ncbi:hypothetical protein [Granulicatella seriolae]|uniref:Type II secretion system protein n=1 Tax=Granulicatella seriolae TaxID=2967226 RepID=A0ABT1WMP8_9LACT|nr:hypothetical protein [Granulicatella seriolae]